MGAPGSPKRSLTEGKFGRPRSGNAPVSAFPADSVMGSRDTGRHIGTNPVSVSALAIVRSSRANNIEGQSRAKHVIDCT
jgi:hypothetical protein